MTSTLSHALAAYRTAAAQVHPLVAVVKLYDEVLRRVGLAIEDTRDQRIEDAYINITKACAVMRGLSSNLRFDLAPDMAETLKSTYVANMIALHTAFGKPDAAARYFVVMEALLGLRNAWASVASVAEISALPASIREIALDHDKSR